MLSASAKPERWLWLLTIVGCVFRLYDLGGESLWLDEVVTAERVYEPIGQIVLGWDSVTQGPLYYLWVKAWCLLVGTNEWTLRIWSVVWGTLTIPAVFQLGRLLFTRSVAMWSALIMTVLPFAVHYSQEARPYALFLLLSTLSFRYWSQLLAEHTRRDAILYVVATAGAFYTHPFAVFLIMAQLLHAIVFRGDERVAAAWRTPRPFVWTLVCLGLACLPEIVQNLSAMKAKVGGTSSAGWIPVPDWTWFLQTPVQFFMSMTFGAAVLTITMALIVLSTRGDRVLRECVKWSLVVVGCFWCVPWIVSHALSPVAVMRYAAPSLLALVFLMAAATVALPKLPQLGVGIVLALLTAFPLWNYYTKVDKDPWRQTAEYLTGVVGPRDVIVSYPYFTRGAVAYYLPAGLRTKVIAPRSVAALDSALADAASVWVVDAYSTTAKNGAAELTRLKQWGSEGVSVNMHEQLTMNPNRYWAAPVQVWRRDRDKIGVAPRTE